MSRKTFHKALNQLDLHKKTKEPEIPGILGFTVNGSQVVEVPYRPGYVYVRLRNNTSEVIQAYNSDVPTTYNLPVIITRDEVDKSRYRVKGRDLGVYQNWGTSNAYVPNHTHSFFQGFLAFDDGVFLATGVALDFKEDIYGTAAGTTISVGIPTGTFSRPTHTHPNTNTDTLLVYDDNVFKVTGTAIDFGANINVVVSGSVAYVSSVDTSGTSLYLDNLVDVVATPAYMGNIIQMISGTWVSKVPGIPTYNVGYANGWTGTYSNFTADLTGGGYFGDLTVNSSGSAVIELLGGAYGTWWNRTSGTYRTMNLSDPYTIQGSSSLNYTNFYPDGVQGAYVNSHFEWSYPFLETGNHTIYVTAVGGSKLWIDDSLVIDDWPPINEEISHEKTYVYGATSGTSAKFALEYYSGKFPVTFKVEIDTPTLSKAYISVNSYYYKAYGYGTMSTPFVPPEGGYSVPYVITWDADVPSGTSVLLYKNGNYISNGQTIYSSDTLLTFSYYLYSTWRGETPTLRSFSAAMPGGVVPTSSGSNIIDFSTAVPSIGNALVYDGTYWSPGTVVGGGGGADLIIYDNAVFKVTGTSLNFGDNLDVVVTGTTAYITAVGVTGSAGAAGASGPPGDNTLLLYDDNTFKITGTAVHFNNNLSVITSGSHAWVDGQAGSVGGENSLLIYDDGTFKVTGTAINFVTGLSVVSTGTTAYVASTSVGGNANMIEIQVFC